VPRVLLLLSLLAGCGRFGFGSEADRPDASGDGSGDAPSDVGGDDTLIGTTGAGTKVQQSATVDTAGAYTMTLPSPSTAGSLLVVAMGSSSTGLVLPEGWLVAEQLAVSGGCVAAILYYPNNPGGITDVTFQQNALVPSVAVLTEWSGASTLDVVGSASSSGPASTLTVETATPTTTASGVAINVFCEAVNMPQYTTGAGWTNVATASNGPSEASFSTNYRLDYTVGSTVPGSVTTTIAGKYAAIVATFKP
jgi:hypothetical protein